MDIREQREIVQDVSTDRARAGPCSTHLVPSPQSAQANYNHVNDGLESTPTHGGTYRNTVQVSEISNRRSITRERSVVDTYLLAISPFGLLGAHHFYLGRYYWVIVYFFTCGLAGFGYIIDWFRVPSLVKQANDIIRDPRNDRKTVSDAYTLWFPFGLLGFHHYYLENYARGIIYTCTLGLCGIGWIVDAFMMPDLVRSANENLSTSVKEKNACLATILTISPLGIFGVHHFYLNRPAWGLVYTLTLGLAGVGWIADWFRTPVLTKRANRVIAGGPKNIKTLDDAYILWFPFGLLGLHHFYLGRPLWGILYYCTYGIGGLGWLIDMCRIPSLVREANLKIQSKPEKRTLLPNTGNHVNDATTVSIPAEGYPNYSTTHPVQFMATNHTLPVYPSHHHGTVSHNYQQREYENPHISMNGPYHNSNYYPNVYNGDMGCPQFQPPPPYQTVEPNHSNSQEDSVTKTQ